MGLIKTYVPLHMSLIILAHVNTLHVYCVQLNKGVYYGGVDISKAEASYVNCKC